MAQNSKQCTLNSPERNKFSKNGKP